MSVLLVVGDADERPVWHDAVARALPDETILEPHPSLDRARITAAIVAAPPPGSLAGLPDLRLIQSLWAGVDGLLADPTIPIAVPVARLVDPALTAAMTETVLLHVLALHRRAPDYRAQQQARLWQPLPQRPASARPVGVLGLGELGRAAGAALARLGFPVSGWSRSRHAVDGVQCLSGASGLAALLGGCEILVNLLPLTMETDGMLCAELFGRLPRGAALINLGRGRHLVETDLLAALRSGQLGHAVIDVLAAEPPPASHPFWSHPNITLTPHVAASTSPDTAAAIAAAAIRALRTGLPVPNLIRRDRGY